MNTCRSCHAEILFARTPNGKSMPLDVEPVPGRGNLLLEPGARGEPTIRFVGKNKGDRISHFASCPQSNGWRHA